MPEPVSRPPVDPVLEWLNALHVEGEVLWASPEALLARRRYELQEALLADIEGGPRG